MTKQLTLFETTKGSKPSEVPRDSITPSNPSEPAFIRIGLSNEEKQILLNKYLETYHLKKIYVFYWPAFRHEYEFGIPVEYIEYKDIIMYKFFYRLLEEIDDSCLIVIDECMRTQNRSDLTYNCAHHYLNQTSHKAVFEYFPFIEEPADFLILLDLLNKGKYKGKGFDWAMLTGEDIVAKPMPIELNVETIALTSQQKTAYETKKEELFMGLGIRDPDTIPRNLHVFVGGFKKPFLNKEKHYLARNGRLGLPNVETYDQFTPRQEPPILVDFPHRRLDLNDYLKKTKSARLKFLSSGLKVDLYYVQTFQEWKRRVEEFYAHAKICQ